MDLSAEQKPWLKVRGLILVEIRAIDDDGLPMARALTDLMHNVPTALPLGGEVWEREKSAIHGRAAARGLTSYLERLLAHAERGVR